MINFSVYKSIYFCGDKNACFFSTCFWVRELRTNFSLLRLKTLILFWVLYFLKYYPWKLTFWHFKIGKLIKRVKGGYYQREVDDLTWIVIKNKIIDMCSRVSYPLLLDQCIVLFSVTTKMGKKRLQRPWSSAIYSIMSAKLKDTSLVFRLLHLHNHWILIRL